MQKYTYKTCCSESKGFTLVELMIVVAVIAVLGAIAIPMYTGYVTSAKRKAVDAVLEQIPLLLEQYRAENGSFPANGTYTYVEAADGSVTSETIITAGLSDFSPKSASQSSAVLFDYEMIISNSGSATEKAVFKATGVRDGAAVGIVGPITYQ